MRMQQKHIAYNTYKIGGDIIYSYEIGAAYIFTSDKISI